MLEDIVPYEPFKIMSIDNCFIGKDTLHMQNTCVFKGNFMNREERKSDLFHYWTCPLTLIHNCFLFFDLEFN